MTEVCKALAVLTLSATVACGDGGGADAGVHTDPDWWTVLDAGPEASVQDIAYVQCRALFDAYCRGNR